MGFDMSGVDASDLAGFWICMSNGTESFVEKIIPGGKVVEMCLDGVHPSYSGLVVRAFSQLYIDISISVVKSVCTLGNLTSSSLMKFGIFTPTRGCLR